MDYGTVKHLLSEAEIQQQQAEANLQRAAAALHEAQLRHAAAKAAHDEAGQKVGRLKSKFRDQIMDEGLRQTCRWNDMYYKLVEWKEAHDGDTTVPCDAKSDEDVRKLNRWVINQRTAYKYFNNGDKKHIKDHRIDALNKIGFVWSVTDKLWDNNFVELKKWHDENGTFDVTHKQNRKLATFVSRLRTAMNHKRQGLVQQELTNEKIEKLNTINFTWDLKRKPRKSTTRNTVKFEVMYGHLVEFKEIYGHLKVNKLEKEWKKGQSVPEKKVFRRLPLFMAYVRKEQLLFKEGKPNALDEDKVNMLTELGVEWKKPANEPRKSTGGEASRKKRKRADPDVPGFPYQEQQPPPPPQQEQEQQVQEQVQVQVQEEEQQLDEEPIVGEENAAILEIPPPQL